jgi:peroxidase
MRYWYLLFYRARGPHIWPVPLGRRDGRISIANETKQLPPPQANMTQLTQMFAVKGLDLKDLVVLSGNNKHII